jgi:hypothetical protein
MSDQAFRIEERRTPRGGTEYVLEARIQELERALEDMLGQCERCRSARAVLEKRKQISAAGAGAEQCGDLGGIGGFECDRPKGHAGRHIVERKP